VVDDSTVTQNVVKKILTAAKYEVETANDGAMALSVYDVFKPDLVFLDMNMPVMDGKEALKKILQTNENAKIVMLTAVEDYDSIQYCLQNGAVGYLIKPFEVKDLINMIENSLKFYNKNSTTFFTIVRNKLEGNIRKLLDPASSISLKDVKTIQNEKPVQTPQYNSIASVPEIKKPLEIELPQGYTGYVSEFGGQQNGMVIAFIKNENTLLVGIPLDISSENGCSEDLSDTKEFFNILNQKIISEFSNITHLKLIRENIREYDESKDKATSWNEIIKATLNITSKGNMIPIEFLLCTGRLEQKNPSLTSLKQV